MTFAHLTHAEARARASSVEVERYDVVLDLTDGAGAPARQTFRSTTTVRFTATAQQTFIDLMPATVTSVELNGAPYPGAVTDGRLHLAGLQPANVLVVDATFDLSTEHQGLQRVVDPADDETYFMSMTFMAGAQRIYCCFDQPDLKAGFALRVIAPAAWQVVSNGPVEQTRHAPSGAEEWTFATMPPLPTYVTAVVAGPLHRERRTVTGPAGPIELGLLCPRSAVDLLDAERCFRYTRAGLELFHEMLGIPYPYPKYDQVFTLEPGLWAMENAGVATFGNDFLFRSPPTDIEYQALAYTMLHELSHMWFGDLVTMRWWEDSWLNEAFATYAGYLATAERTEHDEAWTSFALGEKMAALVADQRSSTHPVSAAVPDLQTAMSNFDAITYQKGAAVLRQLVAFVGRDAFEQGVRAYLTAHAYRNASLADLLAALEVASGRELRAWSERWLRTTGVATLRAELEIDGDGAIRSASVTQTPSDDSPLRVHRTTIGCYEGTGELTCTRRVDLELHDARTDVPELVGLTAPAVVIVNDQDLTFAKIRFGARSLATLRAGVHRIGDPLARSVAWAALWDMTRDGDLPAHDYVRTVLGGAASVRDHGVLAVLLDNAAAAIERYCAEQHAGVLAGEFATLAWEQVTAARPGSGRQTVWLRAFARLAPATRLIDRVREVYDATVTLPGRELDFELRWRLLLALAPYGGISRADIDAELARDANAISASHAATARVLLPTAAAKAAAWSSVTSQDDEQMSAKIATAKGFWHQAQAEVLIPYIPRYFDSIESFWQFDDGGEHARAATDQLAPTLVHAEVVSAGEAWLTRDHTPAALRRIVADNLDEVRRALRGRAIDG